MIKYNLIFVIFISALLSACVQPSPRHDAEFGDATRATLKAQIINPEAGNNPDTVTGLDGQAARDAMYNYQKSFTNPKSEPNAMTIGVGDGGSN